ncbi:MAG TPA: hypothetical protein VJZ77_14405 [Blastocatellia bacterium]|nr:hypothetical protein [Blastocatellia bacterium]
MRLHRRSGKTLLIAIAILLLSLPVGLAQSRAARTAIKAGAASPRTGNQPEAKQTREAQSSAGQSLPLRRVTLYSNGVAYFERRGTVTGRAEINLSFKQSQVDDVLKSLVVLDLGRGRVGAVSYNSSAPTSARLNEIPFSIDAATDGDEAGGLAGVLGQLQGARVAVTAGNRSVTGAVLTIGERQLPTEKDKPPVKTHTLVVTTDSGELQSFDLKDVRAIKLLDEGARHDITQFANASASARRRDAKTITVTSEGEGQREMVISYTIAAPIWKTTYRVVLDPEGRPFFQGWAVVDNVSEEDWQEVSLSLVSGTPVSFIHQIQKPLYRYRPIVPISQDLNLNPQIHEDGLVANVVSSQRAPSLSNLGGMGLGRVDAALRPTPAPPPSQNQLQVAQSAQFNNRTVEGLMRELAAEGVSGPITSGESGVETAASGGEVGELFEYRVEQPVTVRRDRSALIPILQTKMDGERVSIYNEAARKDRPMHGVRLKNTSALTLEGGSLTVIDGDAYAGEALIERLKSNEQRFISFGLDLGTLVTTKLNLERRPVFLVRAQKGVFEAHYHQTLKKTYTITNQTDRQRIVYVEHPYRDGWKLSDDTQKPSSQTVNFYRFRVELKPRATVELPVTETQALMDSYQLANLTSREVELFVTSNYIDAAMRAELEKLIEMKLRIGKENSRIEALNKEAGEISDDQKRLRENISTLKNTNEAKQLVARYIAKAGEQETRLEQIAKEKRAAQEALAKLTAEFDAAVRALVIDKPLG